MIQKQLPEDLREIAEEYVIPDEFLEDVAELIEMVLRSKSIDTKEEKQNWFNLLPLMNDTQLEKLRTILVKEKTKLAEIEEKYESKKTEIKKKYLSKRQEMGYVKKVTEIKEKEESHRKQEHEEAEELLDLI
mgnify:CR=1 FL=1